MDLGRGQFLPLGVDFGSGVDFGPLGVYFWNLELEFRPQRMDYASGEVTNYRPLGFYFRHLRSKL